ncbi:hypothetical protein F4823DRAFT_493324 [Ustulina deusta]|nr:hypothetical protein F4823DRAFT_493324 [Ustulina deusta]
MSPKVNSGSGSGSGGAASRSAWSRDVRRGASGVTYSRRSYYYDREFSDSIVSLTDGSGQRLTFDYADDARRPFRDPFTRGRVLECASAPDGERDREREREQEREGWDGDGGRNTALLEWRDYASPGTPPRAPAAASSHPDPVLDGTGRDGLPVPGWIVFGANVFVRAVDCAADLTEAYQRLRDGQEIDGGVRDGGSFGVDLDPSHLEAGASPSRTPARGKIARRARVGAAVIGTSEGTWGHAGSCSGSSSGNASTTRTRQQPPALAAARRVCYYLVATVVLGIAASFGVAVWWAQTRRDASAGFTMGGYVIAVDALVVAVVGMLHRPGCRCWKA